MTSNYVGHLFKCALPSVLFSLGSGKGEDGSNKKTLPEHNSAEVGAREVQDGDPLTVGPDLPSAVFRATRLESEAPQQTWLEGHHQWKLGHDSVLICYLVSTLAMKKKSIWENRNIDRVRHKVKNI